MPSQLFFAVCVCSPDRQQLQRACDLLLCRPWLEIATSQTDCRHESWKHVDKPSKHPKQYLKRYCLGDCIICYSIQKDKSICPFFCVQNYMYCTQSLLLFVFIFYYCPREWMSCFCHFCQQVHFLFTIWLHVCFSQRKQPHSHKHWIQSCANWSSRLYVAQTGWITLIEHLNSTSVFPPGWSVPNQPWRRQRMAMLFSSLCFDHSLFSCDTLTVAVSWWQHVIVPLLSN